MTEENHPLNLFSRNFDAEPASSEPASSEPVQGEGSSEGESSKGIDALESGQKNEILNGTARVDGESEEGNIAKGAEDESKKISLKSGDELIELSETATFDIKGSQVSYKDLANSYLTKQEIDRRFSEVDREKKTLIENQSRLQQKLDEQALIDQNVRIVMQEAKKGNIMGAVQVLLNMAGEGNREVVQKLVDQSSILAEKLSNMSDEEKHVYFEREQLEYDKAELERKKNLAETTKRKQELSTYVNGIKEKFNITDSELGEAFERLKTLDQSNLSEGKPLNLYSGMTKENIANKCAEYVLAGRHYGRIVQIIAKVLPERAEDMKFQNQVARLCEPQRSDEYIEDIIRGFAGKRKLSASSESSQDSNKEVSTYGSPKNGIRKKEATPERTPVERSGAERDEAEGVPILSFQQLIEKADKEDSKAA